MTSQLIRRSSRLSEKKITEIILKPKKYTKIGNKIRETNFINNIYSLIELLDSYKVFYKYRNWKIDEFAVYYTIPVNEWFDLTKLSSSYIVNKKDKLKFGKIYYIEKNFHNKNIDSSRKCVEIYASYNF